MLFKEISLQCECGQPAASIKSVGLTDDHQLAVQWHCSACGSLVYSVKPLDDCWNECPVPEGAAATPFLSSRDEHVIADRKFLRSMGVNPDSVS